MTIIYLVKKFKTLINPGIPSTRSKRQPSDVNISEIKPINFRIIVSILQLVSGYQQLFTTLCKYVQQLFTTLCKYVQQLFTNLCRIRTTVHYPVQNTYKNCSLLCAEHVQQLFTTLCRTRTTTVDYPVQNTYNNC